MSVFVNFFMPAILIFMGFIALAVESRRRQKNSPSLKGRNLRNNHFYVQKELYHNGQN